MADRVYVVVGLGFGDEGKGAVTDFLTWTHDAKLVVRFNGGAQAQHRVVDVSGFEHIFSQFGSGTLAGATTYLSQHVIIDPEALIREFEHLVDAHYNPKLMISPYCVAVSPPQIAMNYFREIARTIVGKAHGSTGRGIGEAYEDATFRLRTAAIHAHDFGNPASLRSKLLFLREQKIFELEALKQELAGQGKELASATTERAYVLLNTAHALLYNLEYQDRYIEACEFVHDHWVRSWDLFQNVFATTDQVIFEGAQGALLDQVHGFQPYTTWSHTGLLNSRSLLQRLFNTGYFHVTNIGVTRAYMTRHGAGPFPTEDKNLAKLLSDAANGDSDFAGSFRVGYLDIGLLQYAITHVAPVDEIALTCFDRVNALIPSNKIQFANSRPISEDGSSPKPITYQRVSGNYLASIISEELKRPVTILGKGPKASDYTYRNF